MTTADWVKFGMLILLTLLFLSPIALIVMNSFKGRLFIIDRPFAFPDSDSFAGIQNYVNGVEQTKFFRAFGYSLFITVASVAVLLLCTSMCAWFIVRVKTWYTKAFYLLCAFSMIVPFQMVMFPMVKIANMLSLDNPVGIVVIYLGFGAGLSVFMFAGFIKSVPFEIEEAAMIDGCDAMRTYFLIVLPILKPSAITVAILNAMWIWNDYLLPKLLLPSEYYTVPIKLQLLVGSRGMVDQGAMMAVIILAIIPIIVFYLCCQKYIIKSVVAGAVKG
ncbi:MAG: carbohydrate ABC transporter permease [Oscillospiraceae bacterium]|nr:carbohydrate ABC transporter permease [Oscillospiraceae bacterium]